MIIKQSSTENTATVRSGKSDAINNDVINNDAIDNDVINNDVINNDAINKLQRYNYATQPVHNNALSATPRKTTLLGFHPLAFRRVHWRHLVAAAH